MFSSKTKWNGCGTFQYINKYKQLVIIDRFKSPQRKMANFDVNIFEDNSDDHIFTELFVSPPRLKYILGLYEFDEEIADEVNDWARASI